MIPVPKASYGGYGYQQKESYDQYNYDVVILELYEDIDFDLYPQAEPVCLPEYYPRSKTYYEEKTYSYNSYGYGGQAQQQEVPSNTQPQQKTQIGVNADLECWVAGWKESPIEKISVSQVHAGTGIFLKWRFSGFLSDQILIVYSDWVLFTVRAGEG